MKQFVAVYIYVGTRVIDNEKHRAELQVIFYKIVYYIKIEN